MPPEVKAKVQETIDAILTATQAKQKARHRRANVAAFFAFILSLAAISLLSFFGCSFFLAEKESVAGCTVFYSLIGFLLSYWLALFIHRYLSRPTS